MNHIIPQRIVSLACSNTEILFALGLGSSVVGVDDWSGFSQPVMELPRVGPELASSDERVRKCHEITD